MHTQHTTALNSTAPFTPKPASFTQGIQGGGPTIFGFNDDAQRMKVYGEQLVLIAADNSGSMSGGKDQEANDAIVECMKALADPMNKDGFRVGLVSYGSSAHLESGPVEPSLLTARLDGSGGGTCLAPALRLIGREIDSYSYRDKRVPQSPVVIIFSDGCLGDKSDALAEAATLKAKGITVITIGFGVDVDQGTLQALASAQDHYAFANVGQLRALFAVVGRTLSQSMIKTANP